MSSFYILQINVKDALKLKEYTNVAPATVAPYNGQLVFRGNVSEIVTGQPEHTFAVVIKFPDRISAKGWYESEAYQNLLEIRDASASAVATRYDEPDFF